ncbi:MAG: hypothetical protein IJN62_00515 [Clostridia bacterium]|nr:hypothetical protein [Clostridia bacterium]
MKGELPTKTTLGLDKVDNTPDNEKSVLYAENADYARMAAYDANDRDIVSTYVSWGDLAASQVGYSRHSDHATMDDNGNDIIEHYATKAELSAIPKFNILPVTSLPTEDISTTTVYLVPYGDESQNIYDEYIYVNETWEKLGTQKVDLSSYSTKEEVTAVNERLDNAETSIGDIDTALDNIIAIQNTLIGGETV